MKITFQAYAVKDFGGHYGVWYTAELAPREPNGNSREAQRAAEAFVREHFPKSCRVKGTTLSGSEYGKLPSGKDDYSNRLYNWCIPYVMFNVSFAPDKVNGGFNEAGVKRYLSFRKSLAKHGFAVEWVSQYSNCVSEAELHSAIAI